MPEVADIEMSRMDKGHGESKKQEALEDTEYRPVNWKRIFFAPKYIPWHLLFLAAGVATILLAIYHDDVVETLRPFSENVRELPAGWLIPIVILIILSFPPLFGNEIIALLCGVVYGLWIGFAIVAAGTFIGEIATWYVFKYTLRRKAMKLEKTNLNYGALARMTRDGGFWIVLVIRLSAIPSHFSAAVFSTCDVNFWLFVIATFLSLPKQIFLVYLGVLLVQEKKDDKTQTIMFSIVFVITIVMAVWIWYKLRAIKKVLLEEQAQRRENRLREEVAAEEKIRADERFNAVAVPEVAALAGRAW
ncbi:snare associated Golgi protein-domain-containing protein [Massariosphaeria phaeospora]|uniref:Golgi apparatus membrane protein TVP38 n=1 Tax=Massariosphaeria phaeospora TaxID=100035 RepID=A0A7C8I754_9PLEO|nr:snare associated Golgi protein-domain-containing protein [Massariosphaeria phaeospora]